MAAAIRQVLSEPAQAASMAEPGRCARSRADLAGGRGPATASSPATSSSTDVDGRGMNIPAPSFEHVAAAQRRHRDLRARRRLDAPTAARVLPRRRRPGARRGGARTGSDGRPRRTLTRRYLAFVVVRPGSRRALPQPARPRPPLGGPARHRGLLGTGAVGAGDRRGPRPATRRSAELGAYHASPTARGWRCGHRRSMAFAALGAAEILSVTPDDAAGARRCSPTAAPPRSDARRAATRGRGPKPA